MVVLSNTLPQQNILEESGDILEEQAAVISSCAWALENPDIRNRTGQDVLGSVAILLHSVERELRRVKESLNGAS